MRAVFLFALVCLAFGVVRAESNLLLSEDEAALHSSMAAWPQDEIMPLLAVPEDIRNMDLPELDHALVEADAEADVDADADAEGELDAEADMELDAETEAELDAEVEAEMGVSSTLSLSQLQEVMAGKMELSEAQTEQLLAEVTSAVASQVRADNCGSGWNSKLVPDINMSAACATHDRCYGRCGANKSTCDKNFLADMKAICKRKYPSGGLAIKLRLCNTQANVYYTAVAKLGGGPFSRGQKNCKKF